MQKTKRILWIAAALAAVLTVAVAGCKHDNEDDWTPLTIRNAVLEKYAGERPTVTIPDGVTSIGSKAFSGSGVTAVIIPAGVKTIAPDAFEDSEVKSVSFIVTDELPGDEQTEALRKAGIKVSCFIIDGKGMLTGYEGDETDIVIPAGFVKGIDAGVFSGRGITGVTIPGSVKRVGAEAFADCTALAVVRIEAGVAYIGDGAFARCTDLTSMVIPAGATELGGGVFNGCTNLKALSIHESVTTIASGALTGTEGLKDVHYSGRKAQWEKVVAGKEQYFAGKTVHCADGEDWRYVPGQGTITPGDGTGDHTHTWKYVIDGERGHYQACECGERSETEEHVYDGTDPECNTCGYSREISGDPDCVHDLIMKYNESGHFQKCTKCKYQSASVNHTWIGYTSDDGKTHHRTCTTACGYTETENHEYKYEKINDNNHKVTCKVCNYFAEMEHGYGEVTYQNDGHHQICADCKYDKVDDHAWGAYTSDSNGHDRTCTVCDCAEHLNHVWSNYTNDGGKTHTRKCTATDEDHTETKDHEYKYEKFSDTQHKVTCKDNCGYLDYSNHTWGEYTDNKNGTHTKTCQQECGEPVTEKHQYVSGACACGSHKPELAGGTIDENGVLIAYPGHDEKHVVIPDGVTGIGSNVFWEHWELESIVIPEGVESIGDAAFAGCHALTEVTIPSTVETIGGGAFQNCSKLEHLEIASGVKNIDHGAFQGCVGLTEVTIPGSVETIGSDAFQGCTKLNVITIPVSVTSIGKNALACGNLATVQYSGTIAQWLELSKDSGVGDNVTVKCLDGTVPYDIQDGTLRHYWGRKTDVEIPWNSVETIGDGAFATSGITTVRITEGVKHIGDSAFQGCTSLTHVEIPTSIESIGYAFHGCDKLKTITYAGLRSQWLELSKGSGIGDNVTVSCSDDSLP